MNSARSNNLSLKYLWFLPSVAHLLGLENLNLWQRLNSFDFCLFSLASPKYLVVSLAFDIFLFLSQEVLI